MQFICFLGRILFSLIFIIKSFEHFTSDLVDFAARMGVPAAGFFVPLWGLIALVGGISLLFGYKVRIGAWFIVLFLVPTTFFMHPFWASQTPFEMMMQHYCFWKNISLIGASFMLSYFGAGPISFDKRK